MSDLVDGSQSPLKVAHRYLTENDGLYRASLAAAPISLAVAVVATLAVVIWSPPAPLPPPAVPSPQSPTQPGTPAAPPAPQSHTQPAAPQTVDFAALRDRATTDTAAFNDLKARAEAGNGTAQFYLGTLYDPELPKISFQKDAATAVAWYRKSADQGNSLAQFNLANFYQSGQGVPKDDAQSAFWYRKSADQGFATAQYRLGLAYYGGRGVAKDDAEAARWYWKAADQGDHDAENELGTLYVRGDGVPRDLAQAVALFRRAAQGGQPLAVFNLALAYANGWSMARNPIAAYIWYGIAARWSDPDHRAKAAVEHDRLSGEIPPVELPAAKRAVENWKPGIRGHIGVAIADLTPDEAKSIGTFQTKGAVVRRVEEGSPAARVGLQPEDIVTAVDDQPVTDRASLLNLIGGSVPGQTVALLVEKAAHRGSLQLVRVEIAPMATPQ